MAMVRVTPTQIEVGCDPFTGRPREVRVGPDVEPVVYIERVRDESAAYPVAVGPRTVFDVRTPASRMRLAFQHRTRRWVVEGIDPAIAAPLRAAA
jgi:hypothetical protein